MVHSRFYISEQVYFENPNQTLSVVRCLLHPDSFHREKWYLPPGNTIIPERDGNQILLRTTQTNIAGPVLELDPNFLGEFHENPTMASLSGLISHIQVEENIKNTILNAITDHCVEVFKSSNVMNRAMNLSVRLEVVIIHKLEEGDLEDEKVKRWIQEYQEKEEYQDIFDLEIRGR